MTRASGIQTGQERAPTTRIQKRNRKDILEAAIEVIAEMGFDGARMETISERSGVSRTNIHYYFRTKEDLHREVIGCVLEVWGGLWAALDENGSPGEELAKYVTGKLRASWRYPELSRIFAAEIIRGAPLVENHIRTDMKKTFDGACKTLKRWMDQGHILKADPAHVFFLIWSSTQYYADFNLVLSILMNKSEMDEIDYDAAEKTISKIVLESLILTRD
ncbi:MAG: TetR family transcriptional regulator C-terminal domain-containing protein [Pseudomonadota bacterium]